MVFLTGVLAEFATGAAAKRVLVFGATGTAGKGAVRALVKVVMMSVALCTQLKPHTVSPMKSHKSLAMGRSLWTVYCRCFKG